MRKICGKYESFLAIPLYQLRCYIMYEERLAGSDAILGDFLTQVISAEQSSVEHDTQTSAGKSCKRDALIANSSPDAHKWVDDSSVTECTQILQSVEQDSHNTEFVKESMFKKIMNDQNLAMLAMKKSLDTLNNIIYVESDSIEESDAELAEKPDKRKNNFDSENGAKKVKLTSESESSVPGNLPAVSQKEAGPLDLGGNDADVNKDGGSGKSEEDLFAVSNYITQEKNSKWCNN